MVTKEMLEGRIALVKMALDKDDLSYESYLKLKGELQGLEWTLQSVADTFRMEIEMEEEEEDTFPDKGWMIINTQEQLNFLADILEAHGIKRWLSSGRVLPAGETFVHVSWWDGDYLFVCGEDVEGEEYLMEELV